MESFINWYNKGGQKLHPVERASMVHIEFVGIHPFIYGNGRTSRLLLNLELMKFGYPPIIIKKENRLKYYNALDKAHTTNDNKDFISIVIEELNNTLDLYLEYM